MQSVSRPILSKSQAQFTTLTSSRSPYQYPFFESDLIRMAMSKEAIITLVGLFVAFPPALLVLWSLFKRKKIGRPHYLCRRCGMQSRGIPLVADAGIADPRAQTMASDAGLIDLRPPSGQSTDNSTVEGNSPAILSLRVGMKIDLCQHNINGNAMARMDHYRRYHR